MPTERPNPTDPTSDPFFFGFVSISGRQVFVAKDVWLQMLDNLDFPLDGGGGLMLLPLADTGLAETAVVFAPPANALAPFSEPFRLELAFARAENFVLMGLAAPCPTPDGAAVLFTCLDLGKPAARDCLAEFASQHCFQLIVVHPRTGAVLGDTEMRCPELHGDILEALAVTTGVREMDLSERLLAIAELSDALSRAPGPPAGAGVLPQRPRAKRRRPKPTRPRRRRTRSGRP